MSVLRAKRVLVTGGAGFIGSHLTRRLVEEGAEVHVAVKYNSVIDNVRLAALWEVVKPIEMDLRNPDSVAQVKKIRPELVFHLAAYNHVGDSFTHVTEAVDCNARGTLNLMEAWQEYERFVYVSTSEVYGYQDHVPFRESDTPFPLSPYAVGKYAGELFARMKGRSAGRPVVVIRPFNAFGPYQTPRAVIAELVLKCLRGVPVVTTEGLQTRDFNFVSNLVDGFMLAAGCRNIEGQVLNVGSGREISIRDLARKIHELTGSKSDLRIGELPLRSGEIMRMAADSTRAREVLGWSPRVDLEEGLRRTVEWYGRFLGQFTDPMSGLRALG